MLLTAVVAGGVLFALRAAAREMRLSQMKSDFVSNVSHELRTPLASIRVFGELLRLGRVESPEKVREYGELHRDREPAADPADQQHPRPRAHRVGPEDLPDGSRRRSRRWCAETLRTFRVSLAQSGFRIAYRGRRRSRCRR